MSSTAAAATAATTTSSNKDNDSNEKVIDITVYGATSFVAKHVLRYLIQVSKSPKCCPRPLRISLGGRNEHKLKALQEEFNTILSNNTTIIQDVFIANGNDLVSLQTMASRTKVVLNCAGPFSQYSSLVVAACAEMGTDYVDITGEVGWVGDMRLKYSSLAKESGARIISLCGFDSIPSDLSVFAAVEALKEEMKKETKTKNNDSDDNNNNNNNNNDNNNEPNTVNIETVKIWYQAFGFPNAGTVHTSVDYPIDLIKDFFTIQNTTTTTNHYGLRPIPFFLGDPLLLTHPQKVRHDPNYDDTRYRFARGEWLNQLPSLDVNFFHGVSLPFSMSAINLKVLQASSIALNYGTNVTFRERFLPMGFVLTRVCSIFALFPVCLFHLTMLSILGILRLPVIGKKIVNILFPPGTGLPDSLCRLGNNSIYTTVTTMKQKQSNQSGKNDAVGVVDRGYAYMSFQGDAGNMVTAQCISEAALALVFHRDLLPKRSEDGFGTPAELLGHALLKRFRETTVRPVTLKTMALRGVPPKERNLQIII